jgi:UPF0716 protein FxsA
MFPGLVFLFTVVPALELYLLFSIGSEIGALNTILIIILTGVVGASLARSQGFSILMKIQNEFNRGGVPGREIIHGLMVFAGGLLLLTPGFMTDIIGFSLVFPGTRHLLFVFVQKMVMNALKNGNIKFSTFGSQNAGGQGFYYSSSSTYSPFEEQTQRGPVIDENGVIEAEYKKEEV